jgi:hypothetical protein
MDSSSPTFFGVPGPNEAGYIYDAEPPGGGATVPRSVFTTIRVPGRCLGVPEGSPDSARDLTLRFNGTSKVYFDDLFYED